MAGAGFLAAAAASNPLLRVAGLALVSMGGLAFLVPFWCLPPLLFQGRAGAVAIALVSSIGSVGGFVGPSLIGSLKNAHGGETTALTALAAAALAAGGLCLALRRRPEFVPAGGGA